MFKWVEVLAGVPQVSFLVHCSFCVILTNLSNIGVSIRLFADDTILYIIVDLPEDAVRILNVDLNNGRMNGW